MDFFLVDTHCHLYLPHFDDDRLAVIERARQAGVRQVIVPGSDLESSRRAVALAEEVPEVYAAVGVHPNDIRGPLPLAELQALARHPRVVAVGEIGLDAYWKKVSAAEQQAAFAAQLELAAELDKPVIVHNREAHTEMLSILPAWRRAVGERARGVLHAFSGDEALAEAALSAGFYLGVAGPLTYKNAGRLRAVLATVPFDRILLETDAPYLAPQIQRGRRNEPAFVRSVLEKLAEVRGVALGEVAAATAANAAHLFGR